MHIGFVTQPRDSFQAARGGSVALVSYQLAAQVVAQGHTATIFAPLRKSQERTERTDDGVTIRRVPSDWKPLESAREIWSGFSGAKIPWTIHPSYYQRFLDNCIEEVVRHSIDAIVVNTYIQYLPGFRRALPDTVLAIYLHDELVAHLPTSFVETRLAAADRILCVREHISGQLGRRFPALEDRLQVLPLAADPSRFHPSETGRKAEGPILFVGRLSPEKGVHVLGAAFAEVHRVLPEVRLKLVGSRGMMPFAWIRRVSVDDATKSLWRFYGSGWFDRLVEEVLKRGNGYIKAVKDALGAACEAADFVGTVPYGDLPRIYREASMLVSPSTCVELPTPVFEAMGSGIPVILTYEVDEGGVIRNGETVLRAPRNDPNALAEAILRLISEPLVADRIGREARAAILEEGTWSTRASSLVRILAEALTGRQAKNPRPSAPESDISP